MKKLVMCILVVMILFGCSPKSILLDEKTSPQVKYDYIQIIWWSGVLIVAGSYAIVDSAIDNWKKQQQYVCVDNWCREEI